MLKFFMIFLYFKIMCLKIWQNAFTIGVVEPQRVIVVESRVLIIFLTKIIIIINRNSKGKP